MPGKNIPVRIVSLCPSITETLIDLGLADRLVGVTRYCIHPEAVVKDLPKMGGTKNPDLDAVRTAAPDLVFVNAEENRKEDYDALAVDFDVDVSMPRSVGEVPGELRRIGRRLGTEAIADARAAELEAGLAALDRSRSSFTFAYLIWKKPWMTVAKDTYVSDLLARGGGVNVYAGAETRYPETTLEELRTKAPRIVLLPDEPYPFQDEHRAQVAAFLDSSGGSTRVELVSGDDLCWHGVRSIRGVRVVMELARSFG